MAGVGGLVDSGAKGGAKIGVGEKASPDLFNVNPVSDRFMEVRINPGAPETSNTTRTSSKKRKRNNKKKRNAQKQARRYLETLLDTYTVINAPNGCVILDQFGIPLIVLVRDIFPGDLGVEINMSCPSDVVYEFYFTHCKIGQSDCGCQGVHSHH